jgi:hypothetical protein
VPSNCWALRSVCPITAAPNTDTSDAPLIARGPTDAVSRGRPQLGSEASARALRAQLEDERRLAVANLQTVFDDARWQTASTQDVASMWQQAAAWREDDPSQQKRTIFDRAVGHIEHEARHRSGLNIVELLELAKLQRLEHDDQAAADRSPPERSAP